MPSTYTDGRVSTLSDALGDATGVFVQPRFGAEEARISIRGSGLQRTFHGRGLKLMQDGVPLNLADGSFDFQAVEALSARYVEVWRGANALQYGAEQPGRRDQFRLAQRLQLRPRARARRSRKLRLPARTTVGRQCRRRFRLLPVDQRFKQDGFRRARASKTRGASFANLGYQLTPQLETRFYLGHVDSDSELPGSITKAQLRADPRAANPANVSGDQHRDIRWTRLSNKTVYRPDGGQQLELFLYASDKHLHHPIFQVFEQSNRDYGLELRYTLEGALAGPAQPCSRLGIAPSAGQHRRRPLRQRRRQRGRAHQARAARPRATSRSTPRTSITCVPIVALVAGVQWARVDAQARRPLRRRDARPTRSAKASTCATAARARSSACAGTYAPQVQFFANVSRSFEPPSFGELAGGLRPTLNRAQRGTTTNSAAAVAPASFDWDVAIYESRLTDELLQIATNSIGANVTVNAPRTVHRGLEAGTGRPRVAQRGRPRRVARRRAGQRLPVPRRSDTACPKASAVCSSAAAGRRAFRA